MAGGPPGSSQAPPRRSRSKALALIVMMPLKRVEPHVPMVDRHTGFVQALNPPNPAPHLRRHRAAPSPSWSSMSPPAKA
jgi:hypothetical protein